jgi:predicted nucleotidyltransferase component of viral defense system
MDKAYADTVRLLLSIAPDVFANDIFAMKGGTAINLFVRDMPRLSVDIDVVYTPLQTSREEALQAIRHELDAIADRVARLGLTTHKIHSQALDDTKLLIDSAEAQVKVEVNVVFRGTVMPIERRPLNVKTADMFSVAMELPVLAPAELYGSKLVAAMDRQHPRDLFDVLQMFDSTGLSDAVVECFVVYLAGHNRPIHEVLFGNDKDIAHEYHHHFAGMTIEAISLDQLRQTRARLREALAQKLTAKHKQFLISLARAQPDWALLQCPHAAELPALRWKLVNLQTFRQRRPADFKKQAATLETLLA